MLNWPKRKTKPKRRKASTEERPPGAEDGRPERNSNMKTPNITVNRQWTRYTVRQTCIKHDLYTCGDNEEYDHMLSWVERLCPNTENLYFIAEDIQKHSKDQTVTNVMFLLEKDAVTTTFEVDGRDDV